MSRIRRIKLGCWHVVSRIRPLLLGDWLAVIPLLVFGPMTALWSPCSARLSQGRAAFLALLGIFGVASVAAAEPDAEVASCSDSSLVELEAPTPPSRRPRPEGRVQAAVEDETLARWNLGGNSDQAHPSNRPGFHPGARVVVDATVAGAQGRAGSVQSLRRLLEARARSNGYWPLRICYERALRSSPELTVDHRVRLTATGGGHVIAVRSLQPLDDRELEGCLRAAVTELKLKNLPARRVDADLRIRFWPGDAPLPSLCEGACATADLRDFSETLTNARQQWQAARPLLAQCAEEGLRRDPKLWGRISFLVVFNNAGAADQCDQYESRFPDSQVVSCVQKVVGGLSLPQKPSFSLEFALRIGAPPEDQAAPAGSTTAPRSESPGRIVESSSGNPE